MERLLNLVSTGHHRLTAVTCLAAILAVTMPVAASDQAQEPVLRVEQDWQLVLNEPDDAVLAPQLHTVMSPFGHLDSLYAQVTWNYRELPDFEEGGLQIQAWAGEECTIQRSFGAEGLSTTAETIRWTQVLETDGTALSFKITNGQSTTWGAFGGDTMQVRGGAAVANLNAYSTGLSAGRSLVTYGANRVQLLVITEVRHYGAEGLLSTDSTPKVVFRGE